MKKLIHPTTSLSVLLLIGIVFCCLINTARAMDVYPSPGPAPSATAWPVIYIDLVESGLGDSNISIRNSVNCRLQGKAKIIVKVTYTIKVRNPNNRNEGGDFVGTGKYVMNFEAGSHHDTTQRSMDIKSHAKVLYDTVTQYLRQHTSCIITSATAQIPKDGAEITFTRASDAATISASYSRAIHSIPHPNANYYLPDWW